MQIDGSSKLTKSVLRFAWKLGYCLKRRLREENQEGTSTGKSNSTNNIHLCSTKILKRTLVDRNFRLRQHHVVTLELTLFMESSQGQTDLSHWRLLVVFCVQRKPKGNRHCVGPNSEKDTPNQA